LKTYAGKKKTYHEGTKDTKKSHEEKVFRAPPARFARKELGRATSFSFVPASCPSCLRGKSSFP
jgi:hypothetical protein